MSISESIIHLLTAAFGMFWSILWALILGFFASAMIQTFVSKERMSRALGTANAASIARATLFGALSSSCSYSAASMARALFQRGAHIIPAVAFMVASTNLVVELSMIIWAMMGWQFVLAEFMGGVLLVILLSLLMHFFAPMGEFERRREFLIKANPTQNENDSCHPTESAQKGARVVSTEAWRSVARVFVAEWRMIRKDLALGMLISGALMVYIPTTLWHSLFLRGQPGFLQLVENAILGPIVSIFSFLCADANIPLASVLHQGGVRFGGVLSFIYADLIVIPLLLIYRKYYGWRLALILSALLYIAMVAAGIIMDIVFSMLGIVPRAMPIATSMTHHGPFEIDTTFWLNGVFLVIAAVLIYLAKKDVREPSSSNCCG